MSVSSISSTNNVYRNQLVQAFSNLQSSLSSGNLSTAQQAYATFTQDLQSLQQAQGAQQTGSQIGVDLAAMGNALQSGSITNAQTAFAQLTQDLQGVQQTQGTQQTYGHRHHHHHHAGGSQAASTSFSTDLAAVGSALQSGSITNAQAAFATLMQDLGNNATGGIGSSLFQTAGSNINVLV